MTENIDRAQVMTVEHFERTQEEVDALNLPADMGDEFVYALCTNKDSDEVQLTFIESALKSTTVTMNAQWARGMARSILANTSDGSDI